MAYLLPDLPDTLEECHARIRRLERICRNLPGTQQVEISWPPRVPTEWPVPRIVVTCTPGEGGASADELELHLAETVAGLVQMEMDTFYERVRAGWREE